MNELSSIGFSVLKKLESFVQISPKPESLFTLVRTNVIISEIEKFLEKPQFSMPKMKLRNFFVLCERRFFELIFLAWRDGTTRSLLHILDSPAAYGLISDSLSAHLRRTDKNLTHGHLGRTTMLLLHTAQLDDVLLSRLVHYLDNNSRWAYFYRCLKRFLDTGVDRAPLILNFKRALEFTFSRVMRRDELDYISPICYVGLMECLGFMASSYLLQKGCVYCTKSLLVNMLECRTSKVYLDTCLASNSTPDYDLDRLAFSSGRFIFETVMTLLTQKGMLLEWVQKTSSPSSYSEVLLRLVVTLYPLILTHELEFKKGTLTHDLQNCYDLTSTLQWCRVFVDLPLVFSEKMVRALQIRPRTPSNFTKVLADAPDAVGDRMVVIVGSRKARAVCPNLNAYMISKEELYDVPKIMALLRSEEPSCVKQEAALPEKSHGNRNIPRAVQDNKAESTCEIDLSDENAPFWDKFEAFQVNKRGQKDARFIVQFLRSTLSWLEQTGFQEKIDAQLLEEVRHICGQFEERSARMEKTACLTLEDLYSMWQNGENKLQMIIIFLCSERAPAKEDDRTNKVQSQTHEWTGCSDNETEVQSQTDEADGWTGCSDNEAEWVKEEEAAAQKAARKKKSNKKPKEPHNGRFKK